MPRAEPNVAAAHQQTSDAWYTKFERVDDLA